MAQNTINQNNKKVAYGETPPGSHMGFFKWGIGVLGSPTTYSYGYIVAPTKEHMDLAVMNYVQKYGIRELQSITQEEYESNT